MDWLVGKFFSQTFGLGVTGYYFQQIQGDDGKVIGPIDVRDFRGRGAALGPAAIVNVPVGGTTVAVIGKALFDIDNEKRLDGNLYMLSTAFKF